MAVRPAAFFDMHGTLMRGEPGFELLLALHGGGYLSNAAFAGLEATIVRYRRREVSNEVVAKETFALMRETIAGLAVADVMAAYSTRYDARVRPKIFPYARGLVGLFRRHGHITYAVTNVPRPLLDPLMDDLGIERAVAPFLEQEEGRFTGLLQQWSNTAQAKGDGVRQVAVDDDLDLAASFAFGDSGADVSFLSLVGHPVAVDPQAPLLAVAQSRDWPIVHETCVLDDLIGVLGLDVAL